MWDLHPFHKLPHLEESLIERLIGYDVVEVILQISTTWLLPLDETRDLLELLPMDIQLTIQSIAFWKPVGNVRKNVWNGFNQLTLTSVSNNLTILTSDKATVAIQLWLHEGIHEADISNIFNRLCQHRVNQTQLICTALKCLHSTRLVPFIQLPTDS